ncbi:hypothetical protein B484DRAFT_390754, partial [Ochromonadaceae sp. CCMP2298]
GADVGFIELDYTDAPALHRAIDQCDVVVNTAGPFQGLASPLVLQTALSLGKQYVDVCDDIKLSRVARAEPMQQLARKTGATAIISTGIWPGCSSLLASKIVLDIGLSEVEKVLFSFYTAGSGGAGPTILSATFLILGEDVLTYKGGIPGGLPVFKKSASDVTAVNFGELGDRDVARLNLIECESCFQMGVRTVETYFGTSPTVWNKLFVLMANLIPQSVLRDRAKMDLLARISLPMVRLVDSLVGSQN